jgi:hypothetical protein
MADKNIKNKAPVVEKYTLYPSPYGSHASMVDTKYTLKDKNMVVCVDERGLYVTKKNCLDSGLADPSRNATYEYRKKCFNEELLAENMLQ